MKSLSDQKVPVNVIPDVCSEQDRSFTPIRLIETEIGQPLPNILSLDDKTGQYYQRAYCLIRFHTRPLGVIELQLNEQELSADEYAERIWQAFHKSIVEHLQEDGLPEVHTLNASGLPWIATPKCIEVRESLLQTAPFVSVIISTRERPELLARCVQSLLALHYPSYEIIIVDNAPATTRTADFVEQTYADNPKIRFLREDRPGQSSGRNCGARAARGEILAFVDDDTVVDTYWLAGLISAFLQIDNVVCVTSLLLPLELDAQAQVWIEEFGGFSKGFKQIIFDLTSPSNTPLHPYAAGRFGTGASMAFTAAFLRSIGGFDPALANGKIGGGEDLAAFLQVITRGHKLVYQPTSILYHLHRRDYAGLRRQIYGYGIALTAFLTKSILDNPLLLFDILTKVPAGLIFILNPQSSKNSKKSLNYPRELNFLEGKGMLYGPFIYLWRRWKMHKLRKVLLF